MLIRQGDVLLVPTTESGLHLHPAPTKTVMQGEKSGHHHIVENGEVLVGQTNLIVKSEGSAKLRHLNVFKGMEWTKEHFDIIIPKGVYAVVTQQEYAYGQKRKKTLD